MKRNENVQYIGKKKVDDKRQRKTETTNTNATEKEIKVGVVKIYVYILLHTVVLLSLYAIHSSSPTCYCSILSIVWCVVLLLVFVLAISSLSHRSQFIYWKYMHVFVQEIDSNVLVSQKKKTYFSSSFFHISPLCFWSIYLTVVQHVSSKSNVTCNKSGERNESYNDFCYVAFIFPSDSAQYRQLRIFLLEIMFFLK